MLEYQDQAALQLYAPPVSDSNLIFSFDSSRGEVMVSEPVFYVAITHQQLDNSGVDMPLLVA